VCKKDNPELFGKLQAADWMADDEAEEPKRRRMLSIPLPLANINSLWQSTRPCLTSFKAQRRLKPPNKKDSFV